MFKKAFSRIQFLKQGNQSIGQGIKHAGKMIKQGAFSNIHIFIVYGLLYDTFLNIYKPFAVKFLERIGGTDFHIALYNALPGLMAALILLPGSLILSRIQYKKNITSILFLISRFIILLLAFVPTISSQYQPILFVALIATMNLPEALAQASLQTVLGNIFNNNMRVKAITTRTKFGNVAIPIVTLITGLVIGIFPKTDAERILYYQIFYVIAFLVGIAEVFTFRRFKEKANPYAMAHTVSLSIVKDIFRNSRFTKYLLTILVFHFVWQAGWPLSTIYQIKTLAANEIWLAVFAVSAGAASFFSAGFWNKYIMKNGNYKALTFAVFCMGLNMISIALSPNLPMMIFATAYSGFAVLGITSTLFKGLLDHTPDENRIVYIGIYSTFTNLSLFLSPFVSNILLENYGIVASMIIVGIGRLSVAGLFFLVFWNKKAVTS